MKTLSVGFIGGGRVTKIFLQALRHSESNFSSVTVFDTNQAVSEDLKKGYPNIETVDSISLAAAKDIVFIALHPPVIMETMARIKEDLRPEAILVSLAPKLSMEKLQTASGLQQIVRMIPNATSYINQGYNPICFSDGVDPDIKNRLLKLLAIMGKTFEVPENKLEGYAILSAMLPTYFWFQWTELERLGSEMGLTEDESRTAVRDTLIASIHLLYDSGLTAGQVNDLIPVKPIGEAEEKIRDTYRQMLLPLYQKIKP